MSGFSADWLALREPADQAARNAKLAARLALHLSSCPHLRIVDLGSGTGATLRGLGPVFRQPQTWCLIDYDPALLDVARSQHSDIETVEANLAIHLEPLLDRPADLVTNSALLDLVSEAWLDRLAVVTAQRRLPVFAALIYDGRIGFTPAHPLDLVIRQAFNQDMSRNKGFGIACGIDAPKRAEASFRRVGYGVATGRSDWRLGPRSAALQLALIDGWAAAVSAYHPAGVAEWQQARTIWVEQGVSRLIVGHVDLLAIPG